MFIWYQNRIGAAVEQFSVDEQFLDDNFLNTDTHQRDHAHRTSVSSSDVRQKDNGSAFSHRKQSVYHFPNVDQNQAMDTNSLVDTSNIKNDIDQMNASPQSKSISVSQIFSLITQHQMEIDQRTKQLQSTVIKQENINETNTENNSSENAVGSTTIAQNIQSPASVNAPMAEPGVRERRVSESRKRHRMYSPDISPSDHFDDEVDNSNGSWNSEDDPNRLWCICRKPHNYAFMLCCDKCDEWFHGKCVAITKQMCHEMNQRGSKWFCPNCVNINSMIEPTKSSPI